MAGWVKMMIVGTALLYPDPARAERWLALTLGSDGAWGAAAADNVSAAMATAIAQCRERSPSSPASMSGCGALLRTARSGWGVAEICGGHWHVSVERTLAEAESSLHAWKLSIKYEHGLTLPECRRAATIGPDGNVHELAGAGFHM